MELVSVKNAARLLGLHEQTVYRKISRGEIPCRRIGRTIRVCLDSDDDGKPGIPFALHSRLPDFLSDLFWDVDFPLLNASSDLVLERILEVGDLGAVRWLIANRSRSEMQRYLKSKGKRRLSPKSLRFWQMILGVDNALGHPDASTTKSLGETGWR